MTENTGAALDLEALRSFVTVAQQGSLAAAAELRHRTVSALSMQIKRLEQRLEADRRLMQRWPARSLVEISGFATRYLLLHFISNKKV